MSEKIYVTQAGLEELRKEYDNLIHVVRQEVIEDLRAARAQGDLSENADYDAARDRQAQVEARIAQLDVMLKNVVIIGEGNGQTVQLGSTFTVEELDTGDKGTYTIVGSVEADPLAGKLSNATPLAIAVMDHKVGDTVTVDCDDAYQVKIADIIVK